MPFLTDEKSTEASAPVELFTFTAAATTYRYTSYHEDIEVDGDTYTAIAIQRSSLAVEPGQPTREVSVNFPISCGFAGELMGGIPQRGLTCAIDRYQPVSAEVRRIWAGSITGARISGFVVSVRVGLTTDDPLATEIPSYRVQTICNHQLYDATTCKVVRASFTVNTTITNISGNDVTLDSDGGNADGWADGGELLNNTTGERRAIVSHVGNVMTLVAPFRSSAAAGNSVSLYAGCDRKAATCAAKFSNILNFGGHPHMKGINLWNSGIKDLDFT